MTCDPPPQVRTLAALKLIVWLAVRLLMTMVPKSSEPVAVKTTGLTMLALTLALAVAADAGVLASTANGSASKAPIVPGPPDMERTIGENG
jgi:hypothetical protein